VQDHGIGIPAEDQARIFDRFERLVCPRHHGGFGVGLWIARQIAEAHGGTIRLWSEQGKGSRFTLDLPCAPPEAETQGEDREQQELG
jgi:two-component system sensor histidine kinase SenX3